MSGAGTHAADAGPTRRTCAALVVHRRLLNESPEYVEARARIETVILEGVARARVEYRARATVVIPTVVHVVWNNAAQNISDAQVASQIEALNRDFRRLNPDVSQVPAVWQGLVADARIEFALASQDPQGNPTAGITRTQTDVTSFSSDDGVKFASAGGTDAWPADRFLNIWVCQLGGGLLGYAQFPGGAAATDGIVILHTGFGTTGTAAPPFDLGRTTTHEVGHWLDLFHIWGDDGTGCSGSDLVDDTPNQAGPNTGVPTFPTVSCNNGPNGDMFVNYMDYTDDRGMVMFTPGQVARIDACLAGPRSSFLQEPIAELSDDLFRSWTHSHEEDADDIAVYRPSDYAFPPARGRDGLEFRPDGAIVEWAIGRGDAPEPRPGRWRSESARRLVVEPGDASRPARRLEVVQVTPDVLRVRWRAIEPAIEPALEPALEPTMVRYAVTGWDLNAAAHRSWTRLADQTIAWSAPGDSASLRAGERTAERLRLVIQVGRSFQDRNPAAQVVIDKGRHLVIAAGVAELEGMTDPSEQHWLVRPLLADTVVLDVARPAGRAPHPEVAATVDQVSAAAFASTLARLAAEDTRHSRSDGFTRAADWAQGELERLGYAASRLAISVPPGGSSFCVIADHPRAGAGQREQILVTAHLDSINLAGGPGAPAPGADDNASGAAGALEIARVLAHRATTKDLRIVLFGGEEQGLHGSKQYVAALTGADRARIVAVVNMDMIATRNTAALTVLLEGAQVSQPLMARLAAAAATYTGLAVQTSLVPFASDHVPFIDALIPAVLTIEGADAANANIHTANDTLAHIDHDLGVEIVRMNVAAVAELLLPGQP